MLTGGQSNDWQIEESEHQSDVLWMATANLALTYCYQ